VAQKMKVSQGLRYIGDGSIWIQRIDGRDSPVPPRDLTPEEVERRGRAELLKSGLYAEMEVETPQPEQDEVNYGSISEN